MDLNLDILTAPGRKPAPLTAEVSRELREEDLGLIGTMVQEAPKLQRITDRHHALAKMLAAGMSEGEAAAFTGLTPARVSVLKASPAFKELLAIYRDAADAQYAELHAQLAGMSKDSIVELRNRLEDEPEKISIGQLLEMAKIGADRSGFGPSVKQEQTINVNLSARLESARKRALELRDITPESEE